MEKLHAPQQIEGLTIILVHSQLRGVALASTGGAALPQRVVSRFADVVDFCCDALLVLPYRHQSEPFTTCL